MDEQLTRKVVEELSKHHSSNEIVRMVCEETGVNWSEAEHMVKQVVTEHARTIVRRQSPLLIFLSIGSLVIGAAMLAYSAEFFMAFFQGQPLDMILSARMGYYRIVGALTGTGMVIGGLLGLYNTFAKYFET